MDMKNTAAALPLDPATKTGERVAGTLRRLGTEPARARLGELAEAAGVSPFHLQRSFRRWVGISPRQFAAFVQVCRAKGLLRAAGTVLEVSLELGMSSPARLHDHFCAVEAMSPGEDKAVGAGVWLRFGEGATPFGRTAVGWTARGICRMGFVDGDGDGFSARLRREWPRADIIRDDAGARGLLARAFAPGARVDAPLALGVRGTAFQIAVWRALLEIPAGSVVTYAEVAARAGHPGSARAAGTAIGDNPVAWLIPCHRVIRGSGVLGGYRWGLERKMGMLAGEIAGRGAGG